MRAAKSALDESTATCRAPALLYPTLRAAENAMLLNPEQPDTVSLTQRANLDTHLEAAGLLFFFA